MWDNWIEEGAPVTACGVAGAATGVVDAVIAGAGPELAFHLSALGAVAGVLFGGCVAGVADRLGRYRSGRRLLRDGPLVVLTLLPLAFLAYAWRRRLALDAFEPRVFLLPVFFALVARTLHLVFEWATAGDAPAGRRLVLVAWAALATAFLLTGHGLVRQPSFVARSVQRSVLGGRLLSAARRSPLLDRDRDGYPVALCGAECDCDDGHPGIHPAAREAAGDGVDQDCSGADLPPPPPPPPEPAPAPVRMAASVLGGSTASAAPAPSAPPTGLKRARRRGRARARKAPSPRTASADRPDVLLITVDTLRADHMGCYGYGRDTTPFVDGLAEEGVLFEEVRSQGPMTAWSMSSMVTGRYFTELSRTDSKWPRVKAPGPHLGERMTAAGYHTVGLFPQFFFFKRYGLGRGFKVWDTHVVRARKPFRHHVTGDLLTKRALAKMARLPADRPALMWIHYGDPHSDYLFHSDFSTFGKDRKGLYDGEIRFTDEQIRTVVKAWRTLDRDRPLVGLVTSDHGEALKRDEDHGALYHGSSLYDSLTRVPLIVFGDGVESRRVAGPVGLVDVLPTLMDWAGLRPDSALPGRSLTPWTRGRSLASRPVFSEKPRPAELALKSMLDWPYKLIWHQSLNQYSLFDVAADPRELTDIFGGEPARDAALVERMVRWRTEDLDEIPPKGGG